MATNKHSETVDDVMDSLDTLEDVLAPILSSPFPETLSKLAPLERAKVQTMLAYVTQDLVYMYLKTRGIDPLTHPVMKQMVEVKKYFDKIKEAEDPAKRKYAVDKGAAKRFIMNAISMPKEGVAGPSTTIPEAPGPESNVAGTETSDDSESEDTSSSEDEAASQPVPVVIASAAAPTASTGEKRKRPTALEVYAGYGDQATEIPGPSKPKSKKKKVPER